VRIAESQRFENGSPVLEEAYENHDKEALRTAWLVAMDAHRIIEMRENYPLNQLIIVFDFSEAELRGHEDPRSFRDQ
jgi:hypothetical protein